LSPKRTHSALDQEILNALRSRPLLTQDLAKELSENPRKIYSRCRQLEKLGSLGSELILTKRLLYCVDDQEVVTGDNYDECHAQDHELRLFHIKERRWHLASSKRSS
jgi:hypothetical protein